MSNHMSDEPDPKPKKLRLVPIDPNRTKPILTAQECDALERMIVRRALERGLKVRLPSGEIIEPDMPSDDA